MARSQTRLAALIGALLLIPAAQAATIHWSAGGSGDFDVGANWDSGTVPGSGDSAYINGSTASPPVITVDTAEHVYSLQVATSSSSAAQVSVSGGSLTTDDSITLGSGSGSEGILSIDGASSSVQAGSITNVGYGADGTLSVTGGGGFQGTGMFLGGSFPGGNGQLIVDGSGSQVDLTANLVVGETIGTGSAQVSNGGVVQVGGSLRVAHDAFGGTSTLDISGAGSQVAVTGQALLGFGGDAEVNITSGGNLTAANLVIASDDGSDSTVTVGSSGSIDVTSQLTIGDSGAAALVVDNGGSVSTATGVLAENHTTEGSNSAVLTINSGGSVSSTGDWTVAARNYDGTIDVNGGQFSTLGSVTLGQGSGFASNGEMILNGNADVDIADTLLLEETGILTMNSGRLTVDTLYFSNGSQFNFTGGALEATTIDGDVANDAGRVEPGESPGILAINGNYYQGANAVLEIEIGGTNQGVDFDLLTVDGDLELGGTLELMLIDAFIPPINTSFDILDWTGAITGTFDNVYSLGATWDLSQLYTDGIVTLVGYDDMGVAPANTGNYDATGVPVPGSAWLLLAGLGLAPRLYRAAARTPL
ncbi:MAG: beta strand repeat-containing protein [Gammaproteobacteria bacterium]